MFVVTIENSMSFRRSMPRPYIDRERERERERETTYPDLLRCTLPSSFALLAMESMASTSHEEHSRLVKMVAMQGGSSQDSYADNSSFQNHNFHTVAKPRLAIALKHVVHNITSRQWPHIAIADLGCSHGRNTLDYAEFVLYTLQQNCLSCEEDGRAIENQRRTCKEEDAMTMQDLREMEIQYFFADLPSNDFNALFQSLQPYLYQSNGVCTGKDSRPLPKMFATGVPGSFYGRLFPSASLHLVICAYSLHWLSQVPPSVFDRSSLAWNGEHIGINKASASVKQAYAEQSKIGMKSFLKCRALELAHGGVMFLFIPARAPDKDYLSSNLNSIPLGATWELFDYAFKEMVDEGLLSLEEMEMFNVPIYVFDQQEFECMLLDVPELEVLHMETVENIALFQERKDKMHVIQLWTGAMSSAMRPLLEAQLGKYNADEVLKRINNIASKLDCFNATITHNLIITYLQRRS